MQLGPDKGVGFDIAENIIGQAKETAQKAGIRNSSFLDCNILDILAEYHGQFDFILFTIGAITWFQDLTQLLQKVSECLKPGGLLFLLDFHLVMNMLPLPGEQEFDSSQLIKVHTRISGRSQRIRL